MIDSKFADMKNTGGRFGGSITAAQFIQRFVGKTPWAHLDIAGTGFASPSSDINKSWGSGWGVRLLDRLVAEHYEGSARCARMTEILFYHLQRQPLEKVLPPLLENSLERGWRVVVQAASDERVEALDAHLWTYRDDAFLRARHLSRERGRAAAGAAHRAGRQSERRERALPDRRRAACRPMPRAISASCCCSTARTTTRSRRRARAGPRSRRRGSTRPTGRRTRSGRWQKKA